MTWTWPDGRLTLGPDALLDLTSIGFAAKLADAYRTTGLAAA